MSDNKSFISTKKIALGGILIALTVITLFLATILPTNRLSLYALSSFFISIMIMESGIKSGWVFYAASCLLASIVVQNKLALVPYILFFGVYGIIKLYIEKLNKIIFEYMIKLLYFNIFLILAYFFAKEVFFAEISVKLPWVAIIAGLEVIFVIYDYVYTLFIRYYKEKLKKMLKI